MENFDFKKYLAEGKMLNEDDTLDRELFDLTQTIVPLLKEYARLYEIDLGVDIESEDSYDQQYIPYKKEHLELVKKVLFDLVHGEF
jgi:hypothetical protein